MSHSGSLTIPVSIPHAGSRSISMELLIVTYALLFGFAMLSYSSLLFDSFTQQFWVLTAVLAISNGMEFWLIYRKGSRHFFIKPVILGAIVVFLLQHGGITNFLYRELDGSFRNLYNTYLIREPVWLNKTMALTLASSVLYWLGYRLSIGTKLARGYLVTFSRFWNFQVSDFKLFVGLVLGIIVKLILNYYGALGHRFGQIVTDTGYIPGIIYRFKFFENLSLFFGLCFLYLAFQYKSRASYWMISITAILFEVIFSMTTGNRNVFVFVFLGIFLVEYFHHGHLRLIWIAAGAGVLIFAMTVLQDFKSFAARESREATLKKNPVEFILSAVDYRNELKGEIKSTAELEHAFYLQSVGRFNYVNEATQVMRYKKVEGLKPSDPDFLGPFFTFPLFAVIPQFWILGKEVEGYGAWVTDLLINTRKFDVAMSPIGYSFMAGGVGLVLLVFFISGILMKTLESVQIRTKGVMAFILFLGLLKFLALFDTVVWSTFLNLIRYAILLPPILWIIFKKW